MRRKKVQIDKDLLNPRFRMASFYQNQIEKYEKTLGKETEFGVIVSQRLIDTLKKRFDSLLEPKGFLL